MERSKGKILAIDIKDVEYAGRAAIVELEEDPNRGSVRIRWCSPMHITLPRFLRVNRMDEMGRCPEGCAWALVCCDRVTNPRRHHSLYTQRSTAQDFEAFFKALGGMDAVKPAGDPEEDEEHEAAIEAAVVLHNIGVDGVDGGAEELAAGRNVKKEMMLSDHVCRLTTAHTTFLWVGRFAAAEVRHCDRSGPRWPQPHPPFRGPPCLQLLGRPRANTHTGRPVPDRRGEQQKACVAEEKARLSEKGVRVMVVSHNNEPAVFRHSFRLWEKGPSLGVAPLKNPAPLTTFA